MGETVSGKVSSVRAAGKAWGFTIDSTGKYNTYSVFKDPKPQEGDSVEFERTVYKSDGDYTRWNVTDGTLQINRTEKPEQENVRSNKALKGEFRSPDEMKRSSALASAVNLVNSMALEGVTDTDQIINTILHIAKHFNYFLSTGTIHKSLTNGGKDE